MADQIGYLGLDTREIESALERVGQRLGNAAAQAQGFNQLVLASGAAIAIWAKNFVDAKEQAEKLDKAIQSVAKSLSGSEFNTESGLESRLKEVNSLLEKLEGKRSLSQVLIEKVSDFFTGQDTDAKEDAAGNTARARRVEIEGQLADKVNQQTKLMEMQRNGEKELVELERVRLQYAEKRGQVTAANGRQTNAEYEALKKQEEQAIKDVKDKYEKQRDAVTSSVVGDQAKNAIDSALGDRQNQQVIDDRGADRKQKETEDQREQEREQYQEWLSWQDKRKEQLDQIRADTHVKEKEVRDRENKAIANSKREELEANKQITSEIRQQGIEAERARMGNQTQARRKNMEDEFIRKIAENTGNPKAQAELIEQRDQMRRDLDIEEMNKSSRQRRSERASDRKRARDERRLDDRDRELDRRIDSGARGTEGSAIERRREERSNRALNSTRQTRANAIQEAKGYGATDRNNLQIIADAFRTKGTT